MFQPLDAIEPVLVISHPGMVDHGDRDHDEHPGRLAAVMSGVHAAALSGVVIRHRQAGPAAVEDIAQVHPMAYQQRLVQASRVPVLGLQDNVFTPGTWRAASLAAGAAVEAAIAVAGGVRRVFCAVRPPGHHAHGEQWGGFCYLNNAVIAARHLVRAGRSRVAILDVDVHHGDGTEALCATDEALAYGSLHGDPSWNYPGTGARSEGRICNRPLPRACGDGPWLAALDQVLDALVAHRPEALVISFGCDALRGDPVGDIGLSHAALAEGVRRALRRLPGPVISVLEGGYDESSLTSAVRDHLKVLGGI